MQTQECKIGYGVKHWIADLDAPKALGQTQKSKMNKLSNKAKIEKEIDVLETMNIELEHSVATLRKENETLKQHYKDLYDSIKITRSKTTEQTTSLLANNAELKAQIQEKEVNSRAKVPSNKTTNRNKPVEQIRIAKKPERQIPTGHRFSIKKTSAVHEKTMTLRSCLRWKPTGKIFRTVGLRWVPTGKIFTPSTTKVDSEPPNGSNADITNQYESAQTLDVSAGTSNLSAGTSFNPKKEELRVWLLKRLISHKPGLQGILT
ncbi:hypothetical protein Tco_0522485 [Tanacetum coccineum]